MSVEVLDSLVQTYSLSTCPFVILPWPRHACLQSAYFKNALFLPNNKVKR